MRWLDAAEQILRENDTLMNYNNLAEAILRRRLVETRSKTPAITLHASISLDAKRRVGRNLAPRFTLEWGDVGLAEWDVGPFEEAIETIARTHASARRALLAQLRQLDGDEFETYLEVLFTEMGYDVTVTGDDGPIDLIAELGTGIGAQRIGIQAKCMGANRNVGPNIVRQLRDSLRARGCNAGAVIATCRMADGAVDAAAEPGHLPVELVDHERLINLAVEYRVGIRAETLEAYSEDLDSVFEVPEND